MISLQETKELLGEPNMSDGEAEKARRKSIEFVDLLFNRWLTDKKPKENKYKNEQPKQN